MASDPIALSLALALWLASPPALFGAPQRTVPAPPRRAPVAPAGHFEIIGCSLGCSTGGPLVTCGVVQIHVNEELRITFNRPVDTASVTGNTIRMVEVGTGRTPAFSVALDPLDPRTLIWRPALTFDSGGNPIFGVQFDHGYFFTIPGQELDPLGPWLTSVDGLPNRTRMQCVLVASLGVADAAPGRPSAKLSVLAVLERDPRTGMPTLIGSVPAEGAQDVLRTSPIRIAFADVMNPALLANPVTGHSNTISVRFDPDGDLTNVSDQIPIPGLFSLAIDQNQVQTHVLFQASGGLPAAGTGRPPGRVVVVLGPQIADLGGEALLNPGTTSFTTEAR